MPYDEGVIKYELDFQAAPSPDPVLIEEINNWRTLLHQMDVIGQDPERYGGLGFGNVSCRMPGQNGNQFIVTGTQTGHIHSLPAEQYCVVNQCDVSRNYLSAQGEVKPSSEAITHGAIYQYAPAINVVMHVHCPEIWRCRDALRLPKTSDDVAYGTPELAREIKLLFEAGALDKTQLLVVPGHEDGVISFGETAEHAGHEIIKILASAIQNFK